MRKSYRYFVAWLAASTVSIAAIAQNIILSGTVHNAATSETVPAVSVLVKETSQGTYTDSKGFFKLTVTKLPVTLVFSSVGYGDTTISITSASESIGIDLAPATTLGQEVVVAATRTPQRILESPVSIERMSNRDIRNAAAPTYYDAIANLKGVDLTTSSLTFRTPSTRGFNGSGNLRFNQLIDGIDNQAPGLNFSVGSIVGPTNLDVDNMELLQGASSALYGSGGMNGTLLINSKDPFKYQGLSYELKFGANHVDGKERPISPYYDWSLRWSKKVSERFAFKFSTQFISANDWQAQDYRNLERNNVESEIKGGDRQSDPNYDGINVYGDEVSTSMQAFAQAVQSQVPAPLVGLINQMIAAGVPYQQIVANIAGIAGPAAAQAVPFVYGITKNYFGAQYVSRTGYQEKDVADYHTYNLKLNAGATYKISNNVEASILAYWGTGTTVYTGADRYVIKNLKMGQYKAELKGKNWFLRGYTIQENSGDAYTATTSAIYIDNAWKPDQTWFQQYVGTYANDIAALGYSPIQAHQAARVIADNGRFLPGTTQFNTAFQNAKSTNIGDGGAKFFDRTDMYQYEGQYNLTPVVKFAETLVGASFRRYHLNSHGTIFADTAGPIPINEVGAYLQLQRWFINEHLKITASGRYDKNENFAGRFTPRVTALIKVAKDNNFRLSYQQAYRFPSTQDQYINLLTGGVNRLIGMGQVFRSYFHFDTKPAKTAESIVAYRNSLAMGTPPPAAAALLVVANYPDLKPERMSSYEIGYRGLLTKKLLVDAYFYFSQYDDFIARVAVGRGKSASTDPLQELTELASPYTTSNYSFVENSPTSVKGTGWGISGDYECGSGYHISANVSGDKLNNVPAGLITFFNTPKVRYNIGLSNDKLYKNVGFNILWRWQDELLWQGTFGTGNIPAYGTLDAQISYRFTKSKTQIKLGASNLLNKYYTSAFGNPEVGGIYYLSYGYNL
ncbi:MAG TPA: TonB-dependent receptor [Chitinophagaceae bacterium]